MPTVAATTRAINHLAQLADTDILPPLFEFKFFLEQADVIASKLESISFSQYKPRSCFEVLSPKTRLSFRIAHQLYPIDTLLYTAAVIDIAPAIEAMRLPPDEGPFSYRYVDDSSNPQLYAQTGNYHDWLLNVKQMCERTNPFEDASKIIQTDISDFYPRIYFHRIEHILDDCGAGNAVRKIIEGIIKFSRAHQSHGLPVGTAASRLLAEALLNDTDRMISSRGQPFLRYVDDFRIKVKTDAEAHSTLCKLAEHLMITEGLSLNAAKTKIISDEAEATEIEERLTDVFTSSELAELNRYFKLVYDGEDVTLEEIDNVDADQLIDKLHEIMKRDSIDYASVKVILKALRAVEVNNPIKVLSDFSELLYYTPRDFCILIGTLAQRHPSNAQTIAQRLVEIVATPPFIDMALSRLWVAHLFVTQALPISPALLLQQGLTKNVIEKRQSLILRGLLKERGFFREQKTKFNEVSDWEKPALLLAMSCLSSSEYDTWLTFVRGQFDDLLSDEYLKWLKSNKANLFDKLKVDFIPSPRITDAALDAGVSFSELFHTASLDVTPLPPFPPPPP